MQVTSALSFIYGYAGGALRASDETAQRPSFSAIDAFATTTLTENFLLGDPRNALDRKRVSMMRFLCLGSLSAELGSRIPRCGSIMLSIEACPGYMPRNEGVLPPSLEAPFKDQFGTSVCTPDEIDWLARDLKDDVFTRSTCLRTHNFYSDESACMSALDRYWSYVAVIPCSIVRIRTSVSRCPR